MSNLCDVCLHLDEQMEYSHGGAVIVTMCMFNHAHFNLVKRYDQCRDFSNENEVTCDSDTDSNVVVSADRPAGDRDDRADATAAH